MTIKFKRIICIALASTFLGGYLGSYSTITDHNEAKASDILDNPEIKLSSAYNDTLRWYDINTFHFYPKIYINLPKSSELNYEKNATYPDTYKGVSNSIDKLLQKSNSLNDYINGKRNFKSIKNNYQNRLNAVLSISDGVMDSQSYMVPIIKNKISTNDYNKLKHISNTMLKYLDNNSNQKYAFNYSSVGEKPTKRSYKILEKHWKMGKEYYSLLSKVIYNIKD